MTTSMTQIDNYTDFLASKRLVAPVAGVTADRAGLPAPMFDFQKDLTLWALRKGRAAIFADTGLGKSVMQLAWAKYAAERVLILAPLAVAKQTVREAMKWGIDIVYAREQAGAAPFGITITNYEMLAKFNVDYFGGVVLDESSILKSFDGKTRTRLIEAFHRTPMRLCCTATPAPNDISEIANHAEFLGLMTRAEMLAAFFVHDDEGWRLKGHAREPFYRWLASWGMSVKKPSDLGYDDTGYDLPPLTVTPSFVEIDWRPEGMLFPTKLRGITERAGVRKASLEDRVARAAEIVASEPGEQWLIWCGMNEESKQLTRLIPGAMEVKGNDKLEYKENTLLGFSEGTVQILVSKPKIAGHGLNLQRCARMIFVGMNDSFEQFYQAVRRCWRFGQTRPVNVHVVLSDAESVIFENVMAKEREANTMSDELLKHVKDYEREEINQPNSRTFDYKPEVAVSEGWQMYRGDSSEILAELGDDSIDLSIFSPPFGSLYTYSNTERDLGNSKTSEEFFAHFQFITQELLRVIKPGRHACVHVQQLPLTKATDGVIGIRDFRGDVIRHFVETGFIYHGEVCIDKDPQAQAIRTKNKGLLFVQLHKDSSWSRPAFADYIIIFRKPGENAAPVVPDVTNEEWIQFAHPVWYGIKESETLNAVEARSNDDERHICALQLETIERCVRLWSNKGETILDPFAGIASTGYVAIKHQRQFMGIELKPEYFKCGTKNLQQAQRIALESTLFAYDEDQSQKA